MASAAAGPQLTPLLSTAPYLLAYALPLLFVSVLLTFAGTFLTLDRSRSFPPTDGGSVGGGKGYAALPVPGTFAFEKAKKTRRFQWILEGGIGGLAGGYAFGLHLATALALLIPATSSSAVLSPKSFLAIWVLTCAITTPLAGRYRYVAFLFFGITGGTMTALALCIIAHPALLSRIILVGIFLPLFTLLVLLTATIPIPRLTTNVLHPLLRLCTASTGSFGLVVSIALLLDPKEESWANVWERLYMANGSLDGTIWGSSKEQGLSAVYAVFLFAGIAVDWALRKKIGECPDEKWDKYLANYAANLPNQAERAGTFQPLSSFWDRFFPPSTPVAPFSKEIIFPEDKDMKTRIPLPLPVTMHNVSPGRGERGVELTRVPTSIEFLKKKRSKAHKGGWKIAGVDGERKERKPVKFGEMSDDSDSDDDETKKTSSLSSHLSKSPILRSHYPEKRWTLTDGRHFASSSSTPTLVGLSSKNTSSDPRLDALDNLDHDQEIAQLKKQRKKHGGDDREDLDYSDYEEDLAAQRPLWRTRTEMEEQANWSPAFLRRHQSDLRTESGQIAMPVPVPATPSLIRAIDRLAMAQREAFREEPIHSPIPARMSVPRTLSAAPSQRATEAPRRRSASRRRSNSRTRPQQVSPEDAEMGDAIRVDEANPERSPRWEEFWREVRVKAQT